MNRITQIKQHVRDKKGYYLVGGGGILIGAFGVLFLDRTHSEAQIVQIIRQIAWRPENNQVVINLIERSTPSKPVHLVGTNLYFSSIHEAARETGHSFTRISKNINGHIPDVGGDVFALLEPAA